MSLATPEPWDVFRRLMPVSERYAYLDHASIGPLPAPAVAAMRRWADQCAESGNVQWSDWSQRIEELRQLAADLMGASSDEIGLVTSTTQGIGLIAEGLPWRQGDNVVLPAQEFPSNQYPWLNLASRGVEPRRVATIDERLDLGELEKACDARTRLIAVSWVAYATGWRNDLDELADFAHRRGALLFVDGIQALGVLPLNVQKTPVDFLVAGGQKWLLGPEGTGILFIRREHLDRLRPVGVGWNSVRGAGDFTRIELSYKRGANRYEGGAQNMAGLLGLAASLELLGQHDRSAMADRLFTVTDEICQQIAAAGGAIASDRQAHRKSGIVAFVWPNAEPLTVKRHCLTRGIVVNARSGRVRVSPHVYTNQDDIDRLIAALRSLVGPAA